MSWAIVRDNAGRPVQLLYMGRENKPVAPADPVKGCPDCGFHFGWHAIGCKERANNAGDA